MASNRSPKLLKREKVMTFSGEEDLIVPKRNSLGKPDNDGFVQIAGTIKPLADVPSTTGADVQGLDATTSTISIKQIEPSTPTPTTPYQEQSPVLPPLAPTPEPTTTQTTSTVTQVTTQPTTVTQTEGLTPTKSMSPEQLAAYCQKYPNAPECVVAVSDEAIITTPPTFPNWSSLDCPTLDTEIKKLEVFMATQKFTNAVADACNKELAIAKNLYSSKCSVAPTPTPTPTPTSTTTPVLPVIPVTGGFFGGGGGGGLGSAPSDEEIKGTIVEEKKTNWSWLWILLIIGGVYYLSRKENK